MYRVSEYVVNLQEMRHKQEFFHTSFAWGWIMDIMGKLHEEDGHMGPQSGCFMPIGTGPHAEQHRPTSARFGPSSLHIEAHMISRVFTTKPITDSKQL